MCAHEIVPANWSNTYFDTELPVTVIALPQRYGTHGTTFSMRSLSNWTQQAVRGAPERALHLAISLSTEGGGAASALYAAATVGPQPCASLRVMPISE